jgi:hypothetical protein
LGNWQGKRKWRHGLGCRHPFLSKTSHSVIRTIGQVISLSPLPLSTLDLFVLSSRPVFSEKKFTAVLSRPSSLTLFTFPRLANKTDYSFGANHDPGRRVIGKIRGGVIGECKKEFESTIFTSLETSIKLAKGSVVSPVSDDIEQVPIPCPGVILVQLVFFHYRPPLFPLWDICFEVSVLWMRCRVDVVLNLNFRIYECCCVLAISPNWREARFPRSSISSKTHSN